jgi:N-methylhydantoinase A
MTYRIAVDTGGTFTDLVAADKDGRLFFNKALTSPERASTGVLEALDFVARDMGIAASALLADANLLVYGTTRSTNAILTQSTAKTAFFTTAGFPDILTLKEGGKLDPFDFRAAFPSPYIPRQLTFEVPGRISAEGEVLRPLDEQVVRDQILKLAEIGCEAAAVCLVWSIVNPEHELTVGRLLGEVAPHLPYTLSHQLNPIIREYRRASSAAIDASLKPLMQDHLRVVADDLREAGFAGELMIVTSSGGCLHAEDMIERPIYSVYSGPSTAPVAARRYAASEGVQRDMIVCDAGGTSFDVSLVAGGEIARTREKWLGPQFQGHLTGVSAVAVTSIGAGGGSIAWIDDGGLLRVGPQSAGADPGPAAYGRGGTEATVTDAATVLGYLDREFFLGGRLELDVDAAHQAVLRRVAERLDLDLYEAAEAILTVASEAMVLAIQEITINQGVDPRECMLVAGGGAGGLNAVMIARALGCAEILVPGTAGAFSASGAQFADIVSEFSMSKVTDTKTFDFEGINGVLAGLDRQIDSFAETLTSRSGLVAAIERQFFVEARYPAQVWELEVELPHDRFRDETDVRMVEERFHETHDRTFAVKESGQHLECQQWRGRVTAKLRTPEPQAVRNGSSAPRESQRRAFFGSRAYTETRCIIGATRCPGFAVSGPAILEEPTMTVVVPPGAEAKVTPFGNFLVTSGATNAE